MLTRLQHDSEVSRWPESHLKLVASYAIDPSPSHICVRQRTTRNSHPARLRFIFLVRILLGPQYRRHFHFSKSLLVHRKTTRSHLIRNQTLHLQVPEGSHLLRRQRAQSQEQPVFRAAPYRGLIRLLRDQLVLHRLQVHPRRAQTSLQHSIPFRSCFLNPLPPPPHSV